MPPCLALLSVMFIPIDKVLVVCVVFESLLDSLLLVSKLVLHSFAVLSFILPILPVVIRILILKVTSRGLSKYQLVILSTLLKVSYHRVCLSDTLELLFLVFFSRFLLSIGMVFLSYH
jgi:hypothetical protein